MAVESFYITIKLNLSEKKQIRDVVSFKYLNKYTLDLVYNYCIYIDEVEGYWHLNGCFINFFDCCENLFELCLKINIVKPQFEFKLLGITYSFTFNSFEEFILFIYKQVRPYKENYDRNYGQLVVLPGKKYFKFRQKNKKNYFKRLV